MRRTAVAAVVAATWMVAVVGASAAPRVVLGPESTLELRGKSTLHDYETRATRIDLSVDVAPDVTEGASPLARLAAPGVVRSLVLTVPVASMHSHKDGLDKNLYKALKSADYPNITFRMTGVTQATPAVDGSLSVIAKGNLEVAGQIRPIDLTLRATPTPEGVVLEGSKSLLMTDYGIKPPSMMLGALKTRDQVDIRFRLQLAVDGF